jgi:uncharacterized protein (TIGR03118 family)
MNSRLTSRAVALALLSLAYARLAIAQDDHGLTVYTVNNLVSDGSVTANHTDPNLVNPWGIVFNPTGPVWIADNETSVSTLYDGQGNIVPLVVNIPGPKNSTDPGHPTGIVWSGLATGVLSGRVPPGFLVTSGATSGPALFLFATEEGTIAAWAPAVDFLNAITMVDNSSATAIYKGLALSAGGSGNLLYATDFHNRRVDVFNDSFQPVQVSGGFTDPDIPDDFAPFGIQAINGDIYVTYAQQDADKVDDVHGHGLGFVDAYDPNGNLLQRVATRGQLNAPWGLAIAPASFGTFAGRLLVGNFGDGRINGFDLGNNHFVGALRDSDRHPLEIDGLWGLMFGNGFLGQSVDTLFFTAGPNDEENGLYGTITATSKK